MMADFTKKQLRLEGGRIFIRTLTSVDATERYVSWINDPEVNQFLATKHTTVEELQRYIDEKNQEPTTLFCGIFLKEDNHHIGTIKLDTIDLEKHSATIALMIGDKTYWGQGLAAEAMELLINYGCDELGLQTINLGVIGQNSRAIRLYEKLGFAVTKREEKAVNYNNHLYDQVTMVLRKQ